MAAVSQPSGRARCFSRSRPVPQIAGSLLGLLIAAPNPSFPPAQIAVSLGILPVVLLEASLQAPTVPNPSLSPAQIAVSLGILPVALLEASLQAPTRITLPRAPPHTLLLSDCHFHRFPGAAMATLSFVL